MFLTFFHHFRSSGVIFEQYENFHCMGPIQNPLYKPGLCKLAKTAEITQSKTIQNGSKTCFNMLLSVFESFGAILEHFRHF